MKNSNGRLASLLQLFKNCVFTVDYSPVLTSCDIGGASGEEVYINWHDAEGDEHEVIISFENLVNGKVQDNCLIVMTHWGCLSEVRFYHMNPIDLGQQIQEEASAGE